MRFRVSETRVVESGTLVNVSNSGISHIPLDAAQVDMEVAVSVDHGNTRKVDKRKGLER